MDKKTVEFYDANAAELARRYNNEVPERLYSLAKAFLIKDSPTLNLGSGNGRDSVWLDANHYPCHSIDASQGMINEALARYPELKDKIFKSSLPRLENVESNFYQNVFCSAVLMHIPSQEVIPAVNAILRIAKDGGIIIISWRNSLEPGNREGDRLFEDYSISRIAQLFESFGGQILFEESYKDESTEKTWHTVVLRKTYDNLKSGIKKIQNILEKDRKVSTYKFALIRALCNIAKYEPAVVVWDKDEQKVAVPKIRIAYWWMGYYWNLVQKEVKQIHHGRNLKFELSLRKEIQETRDLPLAMRNFDKGTISKNLVSEICKAVELPVEHAGGDKFSIFQLKNASESVTRYPQSPLSYQGMVMVPVDIWRDISRFHYWIEDTLLVRWADFLRDLLDVDDASEYLAIIAKPIFPKRDTTEIRNFLIQKNIDVRCVWSGDRVSEYDIDHCIPYSVWKNNDIWNLLPAKKTLNNSKSDLLPHPELVTEKFEWIHHYWEIYSEAFDEQFKRQLFRALEVNSLDRAKAKDALIFRIQQMHFNQGTGYWVK